MWKPFKCRLFRDHDYVMRRQPGFVFLECRRCGRRSHGWVLDELRVRRDTSPLRLLIADPLAAQAIRPAHATDAARRVISADMASLRLTFGDFRDGPLTPQSNAAVRS